MTFQNFKKLITSLQIPENTYVYLERALGDNSYLQVGVGGIRYEDSEMGDCLIIMEAGDYKEEKGDESESSD